jgi:hypothetical protein
MANVPQTQGPGSILSQKSKPSKRVRLSLNTAFSLKPHDSPSQVQHLNDLPVICATSPRTGRMPDMPPLFSPPQRLQNQSSNCYNTTNRPFQVDSGASRVNSITAPVRTAVLPAQCAQMSESYSRITATEAVVLQHAQTAPTEGPLDDYLCAAPPTHPEGAMESVQLTTCADNGGEAAASARPCSQHVLPHVRAARDLSCDACSSSADPELGTNAAVLSNSRLAQPGPRMLLEACVQTQAGREASADLQLATTHPAPDGALMMQRLEQVKPVGPQSSACTDLDGRSEGSGTSVSRALTERGARVAADNGAIVISHLRAQNQCIV